MLFYSKVKLLVQAMMVFTPWLQIGGHNALMRKVVLLVTRFCGSNLKVHRVVSKGVANIYAPNDSYNQCKKWEEMLAKLSTN
jgi:hypothetical protein